MSDRGTEIQLMLPRGTHLHDGDLLYADAQRHIRLMAQDGDFLEAVKKPKGGKSR